MSDNEKAGAKAGATADAKSDAKRQAALQGALTQIERQFGKGTVMRMGDPGARVAVDAIPTGALSLDLALGIGGVPRGRIIEIFGPESSGKTTLVYHVIAEAQKLGGVCAFVDAEHAMDPLYAQRIGVDIDELLVSQPDYGEQALEIVDMLIRSGAVDVIAVDSVAALTPRAELEGQMGDQTVGVQARMMSQAMRKLAGNLNRTQTLCVFTNQIREKVGVMFGSPETQPGGRALKFYASQRLDIRRIETLKDGTEAVGNRVRVKVVKNKVAAPFKQAEFDIEFGRGISTSGCLIDYGIEHNIVTKSGSFFSYGEERLGQGRGNAKAFLDEHPETAREIESKIYAALGIGRDLVKPIEHARRTARRSGGGGAGRGRRRPSRVAPRSEGRGDGRSGVPDDDGLQRALEIAYGYLNRRDRTAGGGATPARARRDRGRDDRGRDRRAHRAGRCSTTPASRGCSPQDKRELEQWGSDRIRRTLLDRGIDRELVDETLGARGREQSSTVRSRCCAGASRSPPRDRRERDRALGVMLRKGYDSELALDALAAYARDAGDVDCSRKGELTLTLSVTRSAAGERAVRPSGPCARLRAYAAGITMPVANERPSRPKNTSKFRTSWIPESALTANVERVARPAPNRP